MELKYKFILVQKYLTSMRLSGVFQKFMENAYHNKNIHRFHIYVYIFMKVLQLIIQIEMYISFGLNHDFCGLANSLE